MSNELEWIKTEDVNIPILNGRRLASKKSYLKEAEAWADRLQLVRNRLVVLGLAAGKHIEVLQAKYPNKEICVFESVEEIVNKVSVDVLVFTEVAELINYVYSQWGASFQIVIHPTSGQAHSDLYAEISQKLTGRTKESLECIFQLQGEKVEWQEGEDNVIIVDRQLYSKIASGTKKEDLDRYYKTKLIAEILK